MKYFLELTCTRLGNATGRIGPDVEFFKRQLKETESVLDLLAVVESTAALDIRTYTLRLIKIKAEYIKIIKDLSYDDLHQIPFDFDKV